MNEHIGNPENVHTFQMLINHSDSKTEWMSFAVTYYSDTIGLVKIMLTQVETVL
jgi:hypothetical protein